MRFKLAFVAALLCAAVPALATPWPQSDIPPDPAVTFGVLPNGMRYAILHNETPTGAVSVRFRIAAGSVQETPQQRGLAHFVEHMAFRGSSHVADGGIEKTLSKLGLSFGADINASTEQDQTVYEFDLPQSSPQTVETALTYTREIASNLNLAPAAAKTEAGVVLSELRLRDGPAFRALQAQMNQSLVDSHATALPNGDPAIIAAAPTDQLRAFYRAYYRPERATLIIVGDIDPASVETRIKQLFLDWDVPGEAGKDPALSIPFHRGLEAKTYSEFGVPARIALTWMSPPVAKPGDKAAEKADLIDFLALRILDRRLRDLAASPAHPFDRAGSSRDQPLQAAKVTSISVSYGTGGWKNALSAAEAIRQDIAKNGVAQSDVDRAMSELRAKFDAAAAGAATRPSPGLAAEMLDEVSANDIYTSPAQDLVALDRDFAGVTADTVTAAFRDLFAGQPLIFISSPTPVEGGEEAVKAVFVAADRNAASLPRVTQVPLVAASWSHVNFGAPGKIVENRAVSDLGVTYLRFANGVRLTIRPSKLRANQVLVSVKIGGGRLDLPRDRATAAWAAPGALIRGGLSDMTFTEMQRTLASKIYAANFSIGEDGFVLSGRTVPADIDTQLQVLTAYLTAPGFRPEAFKQTRASLSSRLQQIDANPSAVFEAEAPQYLHEGDMRWKLPSPQDIADTKLDDVRALLAPSFAHGPVDVIITGDISAQAASQAVAATFGALPPRQAARMSVTARNSTRLPAGGAAIALSHKGSPGQDIDSVLWPTLGRFPDIKDDVTQALTAAIMQQRLFDKLRGIGLTYVAEVGGSSSKVFDYGFIQAFAQVPRDQTGQFTDAVNQIVADLQAGQISPDELERARAPALESFQKERQTNEYWMSTLDDTAEHPAKLALVRDYEADLHQVTAQDIAAMARKYLLNSRMIKLNVGI
jgi:zinc protease